MQKLKQLSPLLNKRNRKRLNFTEQKFEMTTAEQVFGKQFFEKVLPIAGKGYKPELLATSLTSIQSSTVLNTLARSLFRKVTLVQSPSFFGVPAYYASKMQIFDKVVVVDLDQELLKMSYENLTKTGDISKTVFSATTSMSLPADKPLAFFFDTHVINVNGHSTAMIRHMASNPYAGQPNQPNELPTDFPALSVVVEYMKLSHVDAIALRVLSGQAFPGLDVHAASIKTERFAIDQTHELVVFKRVYETTIITELDLKWRQELFKFLEKLLGEFIGKVSKVPDMVKKILADQNTWIKSFTHPSVSIDNYEAMESIGDSIVNRAFLLHLYENFPNEREEQFFSELKNHYAAKVYMAKIAAKHGLTSHVRCHPMFAGDISTGEDAFESFFMALYLSVRADKEIAGYENAIIKKAVEFFYPIKDIDLSRAKGPLYTQYKNLIESGGYSLVRPLSRVLDSGRVQYTIPFPIHKTDPSRNFSQIIGGANLATAEAETENESQHLAAQRALDTLRSKGFTEEYFARSKEEWEMKHPVLGPLLVKFKDSLKRNGFVNADFKQKSRDDSGTTTRMVLIRQDGSQFMIPEFFAFDTKRENSKIAVIQAYLSRFP